MIIQYDAGLLVNLAKRINDQLTEGELIEIFIYCIEKDNGIIVEGSFAVDYPLVRIANVVRRLWSFRPGVNLLTVETVEMSLFGQVTLTVPTDEFISRNEDYERGSLPWVQSTDRAIRRQSLGY